MPSDNKDNNQQDPVTVAPKSFLDKLKGLSKLDLQEVFKGDRIKKLFSSSSPSSKPKPKKSSNSLDVLEMDLIKDEVIIRFDWREYASSMFLFLILAVVLIGESYYLLHVWDNGQLDAKSEYLKTDIIEVQNKINDLKDLSNEAFSFKTKLTAVTPVFRRHTYWSNLFDYLEKNTLQDVYYLNFKGNTSGSYVINSKVKDYRALNAQLKAMLSSTSTVSASTANEKIDNESGPSTKPGAAFDFNLRVKPELFYK